MLDHGALVELLAILDHDDRRHRLHPARMRQADHRDLGDFGQAVDRLLDLAAGDVLASCLDHVLFAVDDSDVAVRVHGGQVAGMEPAALEGGPRALVVVEIAQHQVRRAVNDLAHLARRHVAHGIVDDPRLDVEHGAPAGARPSQLLLGTQHGRERRDLGLAVEVPQPHLRQARSQLAQHLDRHDRRTVIALGEAPQVGLVEQRRAQQRDPHRGRREERRDAVPLQQRQQVVGRRLGRDDVRRPDVERRAEKHVELRAVVKGQRMQDQVVGGDLGVHRATHVLPQDRVVGQHRALGGGLGAAGVHDLREIAALRASRAERPLEGGELVEARHAGHRIGRVLRRQPDEFAHLGIEARGGERRFRQPAVGREHPRPGMAQDVARFLGLEHEIDRHQHRAQLSEREAQRGEGVGIARQHRDAVAVSDAARRESRREPRAHALEFGVGPGCRPACDRGPLRVARCAAANDVGEGLAADGCVDRGHGCLLRCIGLFRGSPPRRQFPPRSPHRQIPVMGADCAASPNGGRPYMSVSVRSTL